VKIMKIKWLAIACTLLACVSTANAWEKLAHVYMADQLEQAADLDRTNLLYGSIAPDVVVYMVGSPYRDHLYDHAHHGFMRLWHIANAGPQHVEQHALGYGFVVHNDSWSADYTAHHEAMTTVGPGGLPEGYVVTKAETLDQTLAASGVWVALGLDGPEYAELRGDLCHTFVEYVVDVHVWQMDPSIGAKLVGAAQGRDDVLLDLMNRAFAGELVAYSNRNGMRLSRPEAVAILEGAETYFRAITVNYAYIYMLGDIDSIKAGLSVYLAGLAYQAYGLTIDPALLGGLIDLTYVLTLDCQAEIEASIDRLALELPEHGIE
jgi:hypothetical protein